tara:strand:+ start:2924 stop:4312 length:1389 start_codon:yes stop_codon:yes gene_type:complete
MKNFKKLIKEAYLGNSLNEEKKPVQVNIAVVAGTDTVYSVKVEFEDGTTEKFRSEDEAEKKYDLSGVKREEFEMDVSESVNEVSLGNAEVRKLEKTLSSQNKKALAKAIKDGTIKTSEDLSNWAKSIDESVNELDSLEDPVLIKARASQMKRDKIEADEEDKQSYLDKKYGKNFMDKFEAEIDLKNELQNLEKEREDVLMRIEDIGFETEQTAEPEGGKIADKLSKRLTAAEKELRAIDNKIIDVKDELGYFRMYESVKEITTSPVSGTKAGVIYSLDNRKYVLTNDVKGAQIGDYTNITLPKGTVLYNLPGGLMADHESLRLYAKLSGNIYHDKPTYAGIGIRQMPDILTAIENNSNVIEESLNENMGEWPKELTSRYSDEYRFELEKVMSDRAKYRVIDIESGELKGTPVFGKPESLMAFADDLIKPQGGTQSTNLGEDKTKGFDFKKMVKEALTPNNLK